MSRQSKFEDVLLASARKDAPGVARRRAAKTVLLATATAASITLAATKSAAATTATTSTMTTSLAIKLALAIAVGAGGIAGIAALTSRPAPRHVEDRAPVVATTSAASSSPSSSSSSSSSLPPVVVEELRPLPVVAPSATPSGLPAPKPRVVASASKIAEEDGLVSETRLLDAAQACLSAGDHACAEQRLAEHAKRFGVRGALVDEARVLAIDAAAKRGDRDAVRLRAKAFLDERPNSPYASRVRATLAKEETQ